MNSSIRNELKNYYNLEASLRNERPVEEWKLSVRADYLSLILNEGKRRLLEIGAGTGKDSKYFLDQGLQVTAVDLSSEMVKHCREKGIEAYELDYACIHSLGMKFDCIWSMNSLLHLEKDELPIILSELNSVLNPDGLFYMGVYGGTDRESYRQDQNIPIPRFFSFFSDDSLKEILKKQFDIIRFEIVALDINLHFQSVTMKKRKVIPE